MSQDSATVNIILPHFSSANHSWRALTSVFKQDYNPVNIVIGCKKENVDELINFTNEYRMDNDDEFKMRIVSDCENFEGENYISALKGYCIGEKIVMIEDNGVLADKTVISSAVKKCGANFDALQETVNTYIVRGIPRNISSLYYLTDSFKNKIFAVRSRLFVLTRYEKILHFAVVATFFMTLSLLFQSFDGSVFSKLASVFSVLTLIGIFVVSLQTVIHLIIAVFDKFLENRRARRENR